MMRHDLRQIILLAVLWLAVATGSAPVQAATVNEQPAAVVLAESWSIGKLVSGHNSRARIVQICVVVMCIALFIMMRKLQ